MTFTKERLTELSRRENVGAILGEEIAELARIALASLEAEPAIHRWRRVTSESYGPYPWHYGDFIGFSKPVDGIEDEYFYSAPPAPVSDEDKVLAEQARAVVHCLDMCGVPSGDYADNEQLQLWGRVIEYGRHPASVSVPDGYRLQPISEYDAMCAAMLHGAEPVTKAYKLPVGWVAVPVEPTEDMIVNGFESEPDESFSDEKEWEVYEAMSGCQQAAHRAKLCWAAMIEAAPKLKHDLT
ncbi:Uncharacterised protein [Enterobacter hormaechei]|uniref:hypothetical protein n=1 Tax=Enterobacter hormaechei TaxID=158836 RepID=UPI00125706F1|nr:hypothetical protein [Enterobacter hormaechei]VAF77725.1 Uncharacterised protein [Enterobacter hormaechei]